MQTREIEGVNIDTASARKLKTLAIKLAEALEIARHQLAGRNLALAALVRKHDEKAIDDEAGFLVSGELRLPPRQSLRLPGSMRVAILDTGDNEGIVRVTREDVEQVEAE